MISTFVLVTVTALIFIGGYEAAQCYSCRAEVRDNATKTGPCWPESFNPSALQIIYCSGDCHKMNAETSYISISSITAYTVKKYTRGCAAPGNECAAAVREPGVLDFMLSSSRNQICCSGNLCNGLSPASSATLPLPAM